jgi:hypothetical protein
MRLLPIALNALTLAMLPCCSPTVAVTSDFDPDVNFSTLKTFVVEIRGNAMANDPLSSPASANRVRFAVTRTLTAKGFRETTDDQPDFALIASAGTRETVDMKASGYTPGPYWGRSVYEQSVDLKYYTGESLLLDVVVGERKKQLAWRGIGTGVLSPHADWTPEHSQAFLDDAAARVLQDFPPTRTDQRK